MRGRHFSPPSMAERLVGRALDYEERSARLGDLEERFQYLVQERGERRTRAWYRWQVLLLVVLAVMNRFLWSGIMFRNNLIIAWRNIKRSKVYSALNVLGLAAGMAVFILIMLFVRYELSYDRYHTNARNIYRVTMETSGIYYLGSNLWATTPPPLAPALAQDFPEVLAAGRIKDRSDVRISVDEKNFMEKKFYWADPQTFEIFSFPLVRGDRAAVLKDPFSVLLSEREASRLFGDSDPVGRTIVYHTSNRTFEFRVSGVFRDIPANSHFVMDIVAPFETIAKIDRYDFSAWSNCSFYTYIRLKDGADPRALERNFPDFTKKHSGNEHQKLYFLQPLTRIHLHSRINAEISPTGDARFVLLSASIAVLVLIIACVNYMNLATARSIKRAKEVGLRKVIGAAKGQLVRQFLGDSLALTFIALVLAVGIVQAVLPAFRTFVEREIVFSPFRDIALIPGLILLALVVGAIAGCYPAFFVSAFRPVSALKSTGTSRSRGRVLRNSLIVFQFAASIALIICTIGVKSQLRFIRNRDMGYEREQILVLSLQSGLRRDIEAFKTELMRNPAVLGVASSSCLPNDVDSTMFVDWPGKPDSVKIQMYVVRADYDFIDLYGLKIVQGRNFSRDFPSDARGGYLINEAAQKALGWTDPVGREFGIGDGGQPLGRIVGVVKDFHMHPLHLPIMPLYVIFDPSDASHVSIRIRGGDIPAILASIRKTWKRFAPEYPFEYSFLDEIFDRAYRTEQRLGTIFSAFAGLAVLIACLGLLGLAALTAEQKTKEIGIRKVLGASTSGIIALLSREFMKWVVLANVIAWPVGYFAMRSWLSNFAYRTSLTVPMFVGAALAAFLIAAAVISFQTYRAATANPVESIRYE
jgi:putative ABC transport system permease protein